RVEQLEQQLAAKRPIRVDKVEYKIDTLYVESIDHGILDLGVHLGGERPRLPASAGYEELDQRLCLLEAVVESLQDELDAWRKQVEDRLGQLEGDTC
ncbi:MAG: hypothetical protein JWN30_2581, partial [Bacilli bacterium]|nr:hypothetical protein [Bacilli bacterium]